MSDPTIIEIDVRDVPQSVTLTGKQWVDLMDRAASAKRATAAEDRAMAVLWDLHDLMPDGVRERFFLRSVLLPGFRVVVAALGEWSD